MSCGYAEGDIILDGILDEADWNSTEGTDDLRTTVPVENGEPTGRTVVKVLTKPTHIIIGINCFDPNPEGIISFSKLRDTELANEDHVRIVMDPFLDGQSGYIFAVNANGARYDALVANRGESENSNWDAIWDAVTHIHSEGWSAEIMIPIQSISFRQGLDKWGFNVERRIQRLLETIRWANIKRDQWFIQTSKAGYLTGIAKFNYGLGLNVRPSLILRSEKEGMENPTGSFDPSLDLSQRIGPNVTASLTVNTDFAEADVDTRQTNLTRFPLFFPERRSFFLEGADIFEFGFGLSRNIIPFFSRRIGLFQGNGIPINAGGKINGRLGKTSFGGMFIRTGSLTNDDISLDNSNMGVVRVKQNLWKSSSIGFISTVGDPQNRSGSSTNGIDFTYQTTELGGDKNFIVGISGMIANRDGLDGDNSALAIKVDYPNDLWDVAATYLRIGEAFDPSLGFVPRKDIQSFRLGGTYAPRPSWKWLRQMRNQLFMSYITDLGGDWQSYRVFTAPINWRMESGDRYEINWVPQGEKLFEPFEIADEVVIPEGSYHFARYRLEAQLAAKRKFNGQLTWWFGTFYNGTLDEYEATLNWNPSKLITFEFSGTRNIGSLPVGDFDQTLVGLRVRVNVTPNLQVNSFVQYDTDTRQLGINARVHWIFHPQGDLFFVINNNTLNKAQNWELVNQQVLLKGRYNFRL
jgi:hypothetical protein